MKRFQHYTQNQLAMFPLDIGQLIGKTHLVRIVSRFVDGLSSQLLEKPIFKQTPLEFKNKILILKILMNQIFINNLVKLDIY